MDGALARRASMETRRDLSHEMSQEREGERKGGVGVGQAGDEEMWHQR